MATVLVEPGPKLWAEFRLDYRECLLERLRRRGYVEAKLPPKGWG